MRSLVQDIFNRASIAFSVQRFLLDSPVLLAWLKIKVFQFKEVLTAQFNDCIIAFMQTKAITSFV